jgi:hypothetical protein
MKQKQLRERHRAIGVVMRHKPTQHRTLQGSSLSRLNQRMRNLLAENPH